YQSPCTLSTTTAKLSYDTAVSEQQGRGEADIAVADAANIGLTAGSIIYYDMERYDPPTPDTLGCRPATVAFLKGWTDRIKELGYKSGTYGSPKNAIEDWQFMPPASRMDAVWMARWDNVPSVWTYISFANFPANVWDNHQRIKQWQAPHNETWGGVTFNIDGNIADAPVAGIPVPRNKIADFDGDGKTDISVYRPGTGQWFVAGSLGPTYRVYEFGTAEDILTPGDFDGDGKTDLAVFRPSNSTWYVRARGTFTTRQFGVAGDIPAAADYNGDGKADTALFRPANGTWYISFSDSLNTFATIGFGESGDKPVVADYDGDGKADIAVWRPSNGTWYVQGSAGRYFTATWGEPADLPAQGDFDGDGKVDFAVFRSGVWYLLQTTGGISVQQFGVAGDVPATGDFDGDGFYDLAVFRPPNGNWYLRQSQAGYMVREFGVLNDKPIPTAYLPQ
ncbi:MAG: FG-GAP-like repeat-containing protein, partial [Pyrinomonadaceae bacterium]